MKKKFIVHQDLVLGIFFLVMSVVFYIGARNFPDNVAAFPRLFSVIMAVLSLIITYHGIRKGMADAAALETNPEVKVALSWKEMRYPVYTILSLTLYVLGIIYMGFFIASAIYMIGFMYMLNYRKWKVIILTTTGLLGAVWLIFVKILAMNLPSGILIKLISENIF